MDEKIMILYNFVVKKEDYYWEKSLRERDSQVILLDMAHLISFKLYGIVFAPFYLLLTPK